MGNTDEHGPGRRVRFDSAAHARGFTAAWNAIIFDQSLSSTARLLYLHLSHYGWLGEDPSQDEIGAALGLSARRLPQYVRELETAGLVDAKRRGQGHPNRYIVRQPEASVTTENVLSRTDVLSVLEPTKRPFSPSMSRHSEDRSEAKASEDAVRRVYDHWRKARRKTRATYDRMSPKRAAKIEKRLTEFTEEQLIQAIDGVAFDPWPDRRLHDDIAIVLRSREQVEKFLDLHEARPKSGRGLTPQEIIDLTRGGER